jgi:hypothetical protein
LFDLTNITALGNEEVKSCLAGTDSRSPEEKGACSGSNMPTN